MKFTTVVAVVISPDEIVISVLPAVPPVFCVIVTTAVPPLVATRSSWRLRVVAMCPAWVMLLADPPDAVSSAEKVPSSDSPAVSAMAFVSAWPVIVTVSPAVVSIDIVPPVSADPASSTVIVAVALAFVLDAVLPAAKVPSSDSPVVSDMALVSAWPVIVTVSPAVVSIDMVPPVSIEPASSTVSVAVAAVNADAVVSAEKVPSRDSPAVSAMALVSAWPVIVTVSPAVVVTDMVPPVSIEPASSTVIVAVAGTLVTRSLAEPVILNASGRSN